MADDNASLGSRGGLVNRRGGRTGSQETARSGQAMYQPGTPLGYLAARGTPYEKKYFTKKLGFCCLFLAPPIILVTAVITLVPVLWAVANHALHTAQLHVYQANITNVGNTSFPLSIDGRVKKTGIFPARLIFRKPVDIYWNTPPSSEGGMRELHLGQMTLARINAAAGSALVRQATTFQVTDEAGFGEFSEYLITQPEFTWQLRCEEVRAEAFSFLPTYKPFRFIKNVVFKGIDNFHDIKILALQLPGDDPQGGITTIATTQLVNPSAFSVEVGTLDLALYYKGMYLGPVSTDGLNLTTGVNIVTLSGRLIPHAGNQTELDLLGELFTAYINGEVSPVEARGLSTRQSNGETISWLSQGIRALVAQIPFQSPDPINPIKGIQIDYVSLVYNQEEPFNPVLFSNELVGTFALPFGFSLNILSLATQLNIEFMGAPVGSVYGPYGNSSTDIQVLNAGQTAGVINLTLPPSKLFLPNGTEAAQKQLVAFQNAFTYSSSANFAAKGSAKAITDTPLGRVLLDGIAFDVTTGLAGLNGLLTYPTIINSVDVTGGTSDAVSLGVALTTINPSNLNLTTGDATFELVKDGVALGNATLPNLNLKIGRNDVNSTSFFDPNRSPKGLETLNRFISGLDTNLEIRGFDRSSPVASLNPTLGGIVLNATLPGLKTSLVRSANLTVLASTGITDDIANSHVDLANPFSSSLAISRIAANASAHGIFLANINTPLEFTAAGKAVTTSPIVPLSVNLYPPDLFSILRAFAMQRGLNPAYIDGVVQLGGFTLTPTRDEAQRKRDLAEQKTFVLEEDDKMAQVLMGVGANTGAAISEQLGDDEGIDFSGEDAVLKRALPLPADGVQKRANLYTGFNLASYVLDAFSTATADLVIVSDAVIGDYGTTLTFSQNNVPLGVDDTLLLLLPTLAAPIVQKIVDGSILNIDRVTILEARPNSFRASLQGALTNAGPFDGVVSFPEGLDIFWEGRPLTSAAFPNISLVGDLGSSLNIELEGQIPDVGYFTDFLKYVILNPSFIWNIRGQGISVAALGIVVPGITINKDVQLTGLNGLRNQVIINSFDVPYNEPGGGIHLTAVSTINNPAQVGVALSRFGTTITRNDSLIGPAAAEGAFTLQALAVTTVPLVGSIVPQQGFGLEVLGEVLTNFVHNVNTPLIVHGEFAGPEDVVWLNEGIRVLNVEVSLPSQDFEVIRLISINQLSLFFTVPTAYNPQSDSMNTTANFFLPFTLPVDIKTTAGPFTANYQGQNFAVLNIPESNTLTDVEARILTLMFNNVPFAVYNNGESRRIFSQFVADVTREEIVTFNLNGQATANTLTGAGLVTIRDIPFNLNTNILGLQNLNARPAIVSDLDVARGFPTYLLITVAVTLFNPSDITIGAGDVQFATLFQNRVIGRALINDILLVPGENRVPTQILYSPQGAENVRAGQTLLENYVQNITSDATVQGTSQTTPIPSLIQALSGITLTAQIPPLMKLIVVQAFLEVPRDIAQTGIAQASVLIANPFTASINIIQLYAQAVYDGIVVGTIDQNLRSNPISAPGKVTTQSQQLPIALDIDPKTLIRFVIAVARDTGTSLGPLPPFLQQVLDLPDTRTTIIPVPDDQQPPCVSGRAFDTLGAVLQALRGLATSIPIRSTVKIDEYQTDLNFIQQPVPTQTDETALYLLGPAGAPLIQLIVNQSTLTVTQANATSLTNEGFFTSLAGSLMTDAPADAYIEFPEPIRIGYNGRDIAEISLPPICSSPPDGVPNLRSQGQLTILDEPAFTEFADYILNNAQFQWRLYSNRVLVRALGIRYQNVILDKTITLDAFNGLPGIVITKFEAPSDGPGFININIEAPIYSPASLGVELGTANFDAYFMGTLVGPIAARNLFLASKATTVAIIDGRIVRQTGQGLVNIGILFSQFLAGQNSTLEARGVSVISPASNGQPVRWLSDAFSRFRTNVILPGKIYQIIYSITLSDLTAVFLEGSNSGYSPTVSNNRTLATFANPFGFGLAVAQAGPKIAIGFDGGTAANLNLPLADVVSSGTSRGPNDRQPLEINFRNQLLVSAPEDHGRFQQFLATTTNEQTVNFQLRGSTDVVAITQIGNPTITGIPFDVPSSLDGINSFGRTAEIGRLDVTDATSEYIIIPLEATLQNPSDITLSSDRFLLPVTFTGTEIGRAFINPILLIPGENRLSVEFRYGPQISGGDPGNPTAEKVLQQYLQPPEGQRNGIQVTPLAIMGRNGANPPQSPYDALEPALSRVVANTELRGIGSRIIVRVDVFITGESLLQGLIGTLNGGATPAYVEALLTALNDLPVPLQVRSVKSQIFNTNEGPHSQTGRRDYATFDYTFRNAYILPAATSTSNPNPAGGTPAPERITRILLTRGLFGSLTLIGNNVDAYNTIGASVNGRSGTYEIPSLMYNQIDVTTTYSLQLAPGLPALPISGLEDLLGKLAGATGDLLGALGDILKQLSQGQLGQLLQIPQLAPLKGIVCTLTQNSGPLAFLSNTLLLALGCSNAVPATIASNVTSVLNETVAGVTSAVNQTVSGVTSAVNNTVSSVGNGVESAANTTASTVNGVAGAVNGVTNALGGRAAPMPVDEL